MRWTLLMGMLVLVVVVAGVATVTVRARPDDRVQLVHDLVDWDDSCAAVEIDEDGGPRGWERATTHASIRCEHLGPIVHYGAARHRRAGPRAAGPPAVSERVAATNWPQPS